MLRPSFAETRDLHLEKRSGMKTANSDGKQPIESLQADAFSCELGNLIPNWQIIMQFRWNYTCRYTRDNTNPRHSMYSTCIFTPTFG